MNNLQNNLEFDKAQAEYALTRALADYAEAINREPITLMANELDEKLHEMFRFANQLEAQEKRATDHMDKVQDQEFKHGEERGAE